MNQVKIKKVNSEIQRALSEIIFEEAKDSILKNISITACETTNDLSYCKVYFTSLDNVEHKVLEKEINDDTAAFLRSKLASKINLRNTPELNFKYDESISYATRINQIIDELHEENK